MELLGVLLLYFIYGLLTLLLMFVGRRVARRLGKPPQWGSRPVWVASLLFVFWDTVPTLATHKYLCVTDYGFREFKSLAQWKAENPGVPETLVPIEKNDFEKRGNVEIRHLNARFDWQHEMKRILLSVRRSRERLLDTKTGEVLGEYVDYFAGAGPLGSGRDIEVLDLKLWLYRPGCHPAGSKSELRPFSDLWNNAKRIGESL